jgi:hypothetical protein
VDSCVLFAGEHTTKEHPDTVGGAMLSGLREAQHALRLLRGGDVEGWESEGAKAKARRKHAEDDGACAMGLLAVMLAASSGWMFTESTMHSHRTTNFVTQACPRRSAVRPRRPRRTKSVWAAAAVTPATAMRRTSLPGVLVERVCACLIIPCCFPLALPQCPHTRQ